MFEGRRSLVEERPVQRHTHAEEPGGSHEIIIASPSFSRTAADIQCAEVEVGAERSSRFSTFSFVRDGWLVLQLDGLAQEIPAGHDGSRRKTCPEWVQTVPRFRRGTGATSRAFPREWPVNRSFGQ